MGDGLGYSTKLQWGHGAAVGDDWQRKLIVRLYGCLQWGHGADAVEDAVADVPGIRGYLLQWGHGADAVGGQAS